MSRLLENALLILTEPFNQPFRHKGASQMPNCGPGDSSRACVERSPRPGSASHQGDSHNQHIVLSITAKGCKAKSVKK